MPGPLLKVTGTGGGGTGFGSGLPDAFADPLASAASSFDFFASGVEEAKEVATFVVNCLCFFFAGAASVGSEGIVVVSTGSCACA